jgi:hypothetical protein
MNATAEKRETLVHQQVQLLSETLNSKEEMQTALTRLVLLLTLKLDVTPSDLYIVVTRLRDIDSEIVTAFTQEYTGRTFSPTEATRRGKEFRRERLSALLEKE